RTFITTGAGYRLEVHPPRDWLDDLLAQKETLQIGELQLRSSDPTGQAAALGRLLDLPDVGGIGGVGEATVTFVPDGPAGPAAARGGVDRRDGLRGLRGTARPR